MLNLLKSHYRQTKIVKWESYAAATHLPIFFSSLFLYKELISSPFFFYKRFAGASRGVRKEFRRSIAGIIV
ncbi:unnamed protein product [Cuscuta campestris]|uniref:Uncharacterized protein n=1 Tax=Cuscuta campestris TaxID=132261 RepID=A0A484NGR0_9ASTE|nr:unnamed protein product [Cuscuta campestris]